MEEIDIIELLKRVKEGKAPKKIKINGSNYSYNEKTICLYSLYEADSNATGDQKYWIDNEGIDLDLDTKIKILDKPIIDKMEFVGNEPLTSQLAKKVDEIIDYINNKE